MIGMLWFDNSKVALAKKIEVATEYYTKKYDKTVRTILVHPLDIDPELSISGISIVSSGQCQRNHLFISDQESG